MKVDYMQHNPNADTGIQGFKEFFARLGGPTTIPDTLPGLVAIQAEGSIVTLSFVREYDDPSNQGQKYTTTWFDMFRFDHGKIAEHWDCALKAAPPKAGGSQSNSQARSFPLGFVVAKARPSDYNL